KLLPEVTLIMLAGQADISSCIQAFQAGADGYFVVPGTPSSLEAAINDALDGWKPSSREIQKLIAELLTCAALPEDLSGRLTHAEQEILSYLVLGMSDKDISSFRGTSESTVHSITNSIFKKLNVHSRREAV